MAEASSAGGSIYQVDPRGWLPRGNGCSLPADDEALDAALAERLVPYVRDLGFTHLEWHASTIEAPRVAARCVAEGLTLLSATSPDAGNALPRSDSMAPVLRRLHGVQSDHPDRVWRFAARRARLTLQWAAPGRVSLAMGDEFAQQRKRGTDDVDGLSWHLLADPLHEGVQRLVHDLNRLRRERWGALGWVNRDSVDAATLAFVRLGVGAASADLLVACNASTSLLPAWRCGVPRAGRYVERIASASAQYGGSVAGWPNGAVDSEAVPWDGCAQSVVLVLPALGSVMLEGPR